MLDLVGLVVLLATVVYAVWAILTNPHPFDENDKDEL